MSSNFGFFVSRRFSQWCLGLLILSAITVHAYHRSSQQIQNGNVRSLADARALVAANPLHPYVATFEERVSSPMRQLSFVSARILEGIRDDGAKVKESEYFNNKGHLFTERRVFFSNSVAVTITDDTKTIVGERTEKWNPSSVQRLDPQSDCQTNFLGQQLFSNSGPDEFILGQRAVHMTRTKANARSSTWESWHLPAMGCIQGRQLVSFVDSTGVVTDTSERVLLSLRSTPPSPELFKIPANYDQVSPSEAMKKRAALLGNTISPAEEMLLQQRDAHYRSQRVDIAQIQ